MKSLTAFLITVCLVCGLALSASAQTSKTFMLNTGVTGYVDSLLWSNGSGLSTTKLCTLKAATDRDTSNTFELSNLKAFTAWIDITNKQGTAGGTHAVACSLMVSMDGNTWFTNSLFPVWATASSTDPIDPAPVIYVAAGDSASTNVAGVASTTAQRLLKSARFGRLKVKQLSGAADTSIVTITTYRQYDPVTR